MMLDPTIPGGGGTIRYPIPQNAMMKIRNSPMDMNTNWYEKLVQTPSRGGGAEGASPDCVTVEQCQSAYRQSVKATVSELDVNLADKAEPSRYQGTAVAAERAGTDGTTNPSRPIVIKEGRPLGNCRRTVSSLRNCHLNGCHR